MKKNSLTHTFSYFQPNHQLRQGMCLVWVRGFAFRCHKNYTACARNRVVTPLFTSSSSWNFWAGQMFLQMQKTNGNRWERSLGREPHSQRWFSIPCHQPFILNFWLTIVETVTGQLRLSTHGVKSKGLTCDSRCHFSLTSKMWCALIEV